MKIYSKFNKIFSMLINDGLKKTKIISLLQDLYNQIRNEEIILCLIKIIIILIYKDIKNIDNVVYILDYLVYKLENNFKIKMINYISSLKLAKQFTLSEELIESLTINTLNLFMKDINIMIKIWYNILISINKLKIKSLEIKCTIYNQIITDFDFINSTNYKMELSDLILKINQYLINK